MQTQELHGPHMAQATVPAVGSGDATIVYPIFVAPFACRVKAIHGVPQGACAGHATNTRNLNVLNKGTDGTGTTEIANYDLTVANMSSLGEAMAEQLIAADPFGVGKHLQDDAYDTVIVDSLSAVSDLALDRGIATSKGATIARPSLQGFGIRSAYTLTFIKRMLALTKRYNKHIIFIAMVVEIIINKFRHCLNQRLKLSRIKSIWIPEELMDRRHHRN